MDRILTKYNEINAGQPPVAQDASTDRLWAQLETQRREIEGLQRQLIEERKKVEVLAGADVQICSVQPAQPVANVTCPVLPVIHTMSAASLPSDSAPPSVPPPPGALAAVAVPVQKASTQPPAAASASPATTVSAEVSASVGVISEVTRPRDEVEDVVRDEPDAKRARVGVAEMITKVIDSAAGCASPKTHTLQSY